MHLGPLYVYGEKRNERKLANNNKRGAGPRGEMWRLFIMSI
jgi:hypothetical protein